MIVASCPACREQVTVPMDASPSSLVRCPLCNAEFRLGEFLAQLPPPLIVVQDRHPQQADEANLPVASGDSGVVRVPGHEEADDDSPPVATEPLPAFDFMPGSAPGPPPGRPREPVRRPPRKQKNLAWEIAKILGGALLAVPAAQAILWWLVPRDWQRDLLGIGPTVSRVAPWVVPPQFRDVPTELGWNENDAADARIERRGRSPLTSPKVTPRVAAKPKGLAPTQGKSERQDQEAVVADADSNAGTAPPTTPSPGTMTAPTGDSGTSDVSAAPPSSDTNVSHEPPAVDARYHAEDLRVALEQALQASVDWDTSPDQSEANRAAMTDTFYQSFARLGEILAFLSRNDSQSEELLKDLRALCESFARQPNKLAMIGNRGQAWLDQPTRPNAGVILFGTVRGTRPFGDVFATELDLAALRKRVVTVISPGDPVRFYGVGERVLILGTLVPPPADVVAAAPNGQQPETYVWASLPVPLGK